MFTIVVELFFASRPFYRNGLSSQKTLVDTLMPWLNRISISALLWATLLSGQGIAQDWVQTSKSGDIVIFEREITNSELPEIKAVGDIDAPPEFCWNVIRDYERYVDTMPYVAKAKVLNVPVDNANTLYVYLKVDPGIVFVSPRDYILKIVHQVDLESQEWRYKSSWSLANEKAHPPEDGTVRIERVNDGSWEFVPIDDGKRSRATYYLHVDPGGSIPTWLVRWTNSIGIPKVFRKLGEAARSPKHSKE